MKKIIAIIFVLVVCTFSSYSQQKLDRVKLVVRGFDDNVQAELKIGQYMIDNAKWAVVVDSNPDYIMYVTLRTGRSNTTWTQVDYGARSQKQTNRAIQRGVSDLINSIPGKNRYVRLAKRTGNDIAQAQLQQRYIQRSHKPERYQFETRRADATIEIVDPKTREVVSKGIGVETATFKTAREYGYEPVTYLVDGDLSSVGIAQGANLGGNYKQLLQLAAFWKAQLPENHIIGR